MKLEHLKRFSPRMATYFDQLTKAMTRYNINTPMREVAFLAQVAHESGNMRYWQELADGKAYEGRKDLGNTQPGDGPRFKGRGPIQLTGRANYKKCGDALGVDLISSPETAAHPDVGCLIAAWYWDSRHLNALADTGNFDGITKAVNGGFNGKPDRDKKYAELKAIWGIT